MSPLGSPLAERLIQYFVARHRRDARNDLYRRLAEAGVLVAIPLGPEQEDGTGYRLAGRWQYRFTGDVDHDRRLIARALNGARGETNPEDDDWDGQRVPEGLARSSPKQSKTRRSPQTELAGQKQASNRQGVRADADCPDLSPIAACVDGPSVAQLATMLLLARAVAASVSDVSELLAHLRRPDLIVSVKVPVPQFEEHLAHLMMYALVLPRSFLLCDIRGGLYGRAGWQRSRREQKRANDNRLHVIARGEIADMTDDQLRNNMTEKQLKSPGPMLIVDEAAEPMPARLETGADLVLTGPGIDDEFLGMLIALKTGIDRDIVDATLARRRLRLTAVGIAELNLAIRAERSIEAMLDALERLEAAVVAAVEEKEQEAGKGGHRRSGRSGETLSAAYEIVQPERSASPDTGETLSRTVPTARTSAAAAPATVQSVEARSGQTRSAGRPPLTIESLSGYGEAREWALDLKADLAEWRAGALDWDEMSTKLLLSGPPGTGKTTFARALCNTLQVPLFVASMARWLEPGYLGDVLKQISSAFEDAAAQMPTILFIDEIDNIGNRDGGGREHNDYWASLVNRLLELLDGATMTSGVIVIGATNRPEKIDAALLRSGRLEKHIVIPPPGIEALTGILVHHLGDDLTDVLASRPPETANMIDLDAKADASEDDDRPGRSEFDHRTASSVPESEGGDEDASSGADPRLNRDTSAHEAADCSPSSNLTTKPRS